MILNQKNKIYSIQEELKTSGLIEVETIILNGLYKFSILGTGSKNSLEMKDRVYSALRTEKLLNLKSDNRKITINLLPTNIEKKTNIYDLAIALGCMSSIGHIVFKEDILVVGELSIVGNIIPSNRLLSCIYQAIINKISIIICTLLELELLNDNNFNYTYLVKKHGIRFIAANTLGKLAEDIKSLRYITIKDENLKQNKQISKDVSENIFKVEISNNYLFKIIIGLSTNRNIFIEDNKDSIVIKTIKNLMYYENKLDAEDIIYMSEKLKLSDSIILSRYEYPHISNINKQTSKDDLFFVLNESFFGFNIIDDILNIPEDIFHLVKSSSKSSILCFYKSCPCGNGNNFFTIQSSNYDKCLCLQRNIIRHKQKLQRIEDNFFDFYISKTEDRQLTYNAQDYININKIIHLYRKTKIDILTNDNIKVYLKHFCSTYENEELDKVIKLAEDIRKYHTLINTNKNINSSNILTTKGDIELATILLKKGF